MAEGWCEPPHPGGGGQGQGSLGGAPALPQRASFPPLSPSSLPPLNRDPLSVNPVSGFLLSFLSSFFISHFFLSFAFFLPPPFLLSFHLLPSLLPFPLSCLPSVSFLFYFFPSQFLCFVASSFIPLFSLSFPSFSPLTKQMSSASSFCSLSKFLHVHLSPTHPPGGPSSVPSVGAFSNLFYPHSSFIFVQKFSSPLCCFLDLFSLFLCF